MKTKSRKSSLAKSVVWRLMGIIVLASVTYFFTRQWITTTLITVTHHATFVVVFYLHERIWFRFKKDIGRWRNIIKAFTYEIILGMLIGGLIVFIYTDEWSKVTAITGTYTVIKIIMYYFYDRIWK